MRSIPQVPWLRSRKALYVSSALASTGVLAVGTMFTHGKAPEAPASNQNTVTDTHAEHAAPVSRLHASLPEVLSDDDIEQYRLAAQAQKAGDWQGADALLKEAENPLLTGHFLAERYVSKSYDSSFEELNAWLDRYADHPAAFAIYKLAVAKRNTKDARLQEVAKRPTLTGYGDDNGLSGRNRLGVISDATWINRADARKLWDGIEAMIDVNRLDEAEAALASEAARTQLQTLEFDVARWHLAANYLYRGNPAKAYTLASRSAARSGLSIPGAHWIAGIAAWHLNDTASAGKHFTAMAESPAGQSPWDIAASAYWAHRAAETNGEKAAARRYLELAASYPRTFYGILARKAQGRALDISKNSLPELDEDAAEELYKTPGIKRAVALAQLGETEAAEQELRFMFPQADRATRVQLLSVAQALNLPAVQISMAKVLQRQGASYDVALYPQPSWKPAQGFDVDPSLVFAFARQESGFRANAQSYGGALGLMQIMPDTARYMNAQLGEQLALPELTKERLFEPEANITLGQTYLNHLLENRIVSGNLIYLTAAYNAGPGKLLEWHTTVNHHGDPLLFLESIPFSQTRNYVTQVLTSYWIYQEMEGRKSASALQLSQGSWPKYDAAAWRTATASSFLGAL